MNTPAPILVRKREVIVSKRHQAGSVECAFASGGSLRISNSLGAYVKPGDEIPSAMLPDPRPTGSSRPLPRRRSATAALALPPCSFLAPPSRVTSTQGIVAATRPAKLPFVISSELVPSSLGSPTDLRARRAPGSPQIWRVPVISAPRDHWNGIRREFRWDLMVGGKGGTNRKGQIRLDPLGGEAYKVSLFSFVPQYGDTQ